MVLNRSTDRRRRILVDAAAPSNGRNGAGSPQSELPDGNNPVEVRPYSIGAERRHQRKTTDLIPKRRIASAILLVAVGAIVAAVNLLAAYAPSWTLWIGEAGIASLRLNGAGTLASWVASAMFLVAAAVSWQILVLRRHRNDDYDGTYRVWGWLTAGCVLASLTCSVDLASILVNVISATTSISLAQPAWLPVAMAASLASLLAVRVLFEVRRSWGTLTFVVVGWLVCLINLAVPQLSPWSLGSLDPVWIQGNATLAMAACVLLASFTYARFVFLRANGFVAECKSVSILAVLKRRQQEKRTKVSREKQENQARASSVSATAKKKTKTPAKKSTKKTTDSGSQSSPAPKQSKQKTPRKTKSKPQSVDANGTSEPAKPAAKEGETKSPVLKVAPQTQKSGSASKPVSQGASDRLKQLAAASRAKQSAQQTSADEEDSATTTSGKKLSKAERRKQRKEERKLKRAA